VYTGRATAVQVRGAGARPVRDLRVWFIRPGAGPATAPSLSPFTVTRPRIISRSGWGADESLRRFHPEYADAAEMVFVHHTVTATVYPCSESAAIVRGIYRFHVLVNGWNDIGYNFLVDRCGHIFEGRFGGIKRPVIGAHTLGFNTGSVGIAMIGTFSSVSPTSTAVGALERLIAWRLDVAHADPTGHAHMVSGGNPRFPAGRVVVFPRVAGHRDAYPTECPGAALERLLPGIARAAYAIGLPKIFNPQVVGRFRRLSPSSAMPLRFRARFSSPGRFLAAIRGPRGGVIATRTNTRGHANWGWNGRAPVLPGGTYHWRLLLPGARRVSGVVGTLPDWIEQLPPDRFGVDVGRVAGGNVASIQKIDGDVLDIAPQGGRSVLRFGTHLPIKSAPAKEAKIARVSFTLAGLGGGSEANVRLFDFHTGSFVRVGSCAFGEPGGCKIKLDIGDHHFGHWRRGSGTSMRARVAYDGELLVDSARLRLRG
jgi:N-acetylmuramoyl-L-alanine amidase